MDEGNDTMMLNNFKVLYLLTQMTGVTIIVLMGSWIVLHLNSFAGTSYPQQEFNWHPFLMTIGLIFLYGNGILIYRGFRHIRKRTLKYLHASVQMSVFILTVIALQAVFDSHNLVTPPIPNMYSLHSWVGLGAVILFAMQYVTAFVAFLYPGLKDSYRATLMPAHVFFGLFGFILAIASALLGLTEKAMFSLGTTYSSLPSSGLMVNIMGILFVIFGALVLYLATDIKFKRRPLPEDAVLLASSHQ